MVESEKIFAKYLTNQGKTYKAQPETFKLGDTTYRPDFYCYEDGCYYEVKTFASRESLDKVIRFRKAYPHKKIKIVTPSGFPFISRSVEKRAKEIKKEMDNILFLIEELKNQDAFRFDLKKYLENNDKIKNCLRKIRTSTNFLTLSYLDEIQDAKGESRFKGLSKPRGISDIKYNKSCEVCGEKFISNYCMTLACSKCIGISYHKRKKLAQQRITALEGK